MSRFQARSGERLHWRALVRTSGALESSRTSSQGLSWHMVECADPIQLDSHCPVGADLLTAGADPDGHCLVNGTCPRCALANAAVSLPAAPPVPVDSQPELPIGSSS